MSQLEPFVLLASSRPSERLQGARLAKSLPQSQTRIGDLRRIRAVETDTWVMAALDRAIAHLEASGGTATRGEAWISKGDDSELKDVRADAIQTVTKTVLHEIRPLITDVILSARGDLGQGFNESKTSASIERVRTFLDVVMRLWEASASPRATEFDLADLVSVEVAASGFTVDMVIAVRSDPVVVTGDPDLLGLALQNVIRNAVEASIDTKKQVVVNCGSSDRTAWVVVLDEGVGLPAASEQVWQPGVTRKSKDQHFGWGLSITQRAVDSMGGEVHLTSREHGGTSCEIKWPFVRRESKDHEDTAR